MARLPRLVRAGLPHHVLQVAHNHQALALDDTDRQAWLDALREVAAARQVSLHGWVLLPDRFHLLVTPLADQSLSRMMQDLGRRYVAGFNRRHGRSGTLWDGRFRASVLEPGPTCLACLCLIETLPVRARLAEDPQDWAWSSLAHHLGRPAGGLLVDPAEFWALGNTPFEREMAWRTRVLAGLQEEQVQSLLKPLGQGWPTGSKAFIAALQGSNPSRPLTPRPRGRPRKPLLP